MPEPDAQGPSRAVTPSIRSGNDAIDSRLNSDQMQSLIDSILPFEACLFYQVIPLSIEASSLHLGMVNPKDVAALDYVRRQVSYIKYSVTPWAIDSDWHRQILSQYLSYAAKAKTPTSLAGNTPAWPTPQPPSTTPTRSAPAADDCLTFIVDSPDEITVVDRSQSAQNGASPQTSTAPTAASAPSGPRPQPSPADPGIHAPPLQLELTDVNREFTPAELQQLAPKPLMQALLQQILSQGIGRLYLERQAQSGRVLCSQDGVVQSVLDDLTLDLFQSVINELKRLTHLPMLPITKTRQVEIERLYQQERVLLRLRIIPGNHGEEATLQVLRGAALKFYQQQQMEQLGRDALSTAQTLQQRINTIRDQARRNLEPTSTATLVAVNTLLKEMELQIAKLLQQQGDRAPSDHSSR